MIKQIKSSVSKKRAGKAIGVFFALALMSGSALCATDEPQGLNCSVIKPPARAGETYFMGILANVFPRKSEMSASYTGCQTVWIWDDKKFIFDHRIVFENGKILGAWSPETNFLSFDGCEKFKNCGIFDAVPYSSYPKNCLKPLTGQQYMFGGAPKPPKDCISDDPDSKF
jgi:hypothetical protein